MVKNQSVRLQILGTIRVTAAILKLSCKSHFSTYLSFFWASWLWVRFFSLLNDSSRGTRVACMSVCSYSPFPALLISNGFAQLWKVTASTLIALIRVDKLMAGSRRKGLKKIDNCCWQFLWTKKVCILMNVWYRWSNTFFWHFTHFPICKPKCLESNQKL